MSSTAGTRGTVLVVEDDDALGALLAALLTEEGYAVSLLRRATSDAIRVAVNRLEPACVLLDGQGRFDYGESWGDAAWLRGRARRVPVVMLTAHAADATEAAAAASPRSRAAGFAAVVAKPFDLDDLVAAVARIIGGGASFDASPAAEAARTAALVERMHAAGMVDVHASTRREWANGRTADGTLVVLYWSARDGVYYVTREEAVGGGFRQVGRFHDLDAAVALATTVRGNEPGAVG
jgi:DNA-binding response OmpR family regulator